MRFALVFAATYAIVFDVMMLGCPSEPGPQPQSPAPVQSGCAGACENLGILGCPEAHSVPGGDSCEAICNKSKGTGLQIDTACILSARSKDAVHACNVRCRPE